MDDETGNEPAPRKRTWRERMGLQAWRERVGRRAWLRSAALVASGLIVGALVAGTVTAHAADDGRRGGDSSTSREDGRPGHGGGHRGPDGDRDVSQAQRDDEELLTGEAAEQVREAVLAEYPDATIQRVETDAGGDYEAHIVTADDERRTVLVDEDFEVTGTEGD